jgi:hypothetical protein
LNAPSFHHDFTVSTKIRLAMSPVPTSDSLMPSATATSAARSFVA